jgi:zinc transporter ZupT
MSSVTLLPVLAVGLLTGIVTLLGGVFVLRLRSPPDLLLGFSSGSIIGVALFELLPEALELAGNKYTALTVTGAVGAGFAIYLMASQASLLVASGSTGHRHFAPATLTLHSFLDGLGIGLAFHVSSTAGVIVAIGVLAHDLIDGANTVTLSLSSGAPSSIARSWLGADALAPLAGILLSSTLVISAFSLAIMLAIFAGFFLYIGATEILPRSNAQRPRLSTIGATATGLLFIYAIAWLASVRG